MTITKKRHTFFISILMLFFFTIFFYSITSKPLQEARKKNTGYDIKLNDYDDIFGDIYITRPSSLDRVIIGQNFTIKWSYIGSIETVSIALYRNYRFIDSISITTLNDGEYIWSVSNYTESDDYLIGIWDYNDFNNNDFSDFFIISSHFENNTYYQWLMIISGIFVSISIFGISIIIIKKNRSG